MAPSSLTTSSSSTTAPAARRTSTYQPPRMPVKQKMAVSLKSFVSSVFGGGASGSSGSGPTPPSELFAKTDPAIDGDECLHDCESCSIRYPRSFKIETSDVMYGQIKAWSTHLIVGTGKSDWVREVADEKGSVMEAVEKADAPTNGKLMLSASDMPTPHDTDDYSEPTTALLLPAFKLIRNVHPRNVPQLITEVVNRAPTSETPLMSTSSIPASLPAPDPSIPDLAISNCPHNAVILMCSQRSRDVRCGQSAPLLRKEFERHLRPLGLYRDLHDERPGGVGIYFVSHVGGHKYSANVMVYRRPNAFGLDEPSAVVSNGDGAAKEKEEEQAQNGTATEKTTTTTADLGASQCIWLGRVMPEDCENLIRYTVLRGKVVKPENQLRGGFDRGKGLMSW